MYESTKPTTRPPVMLVATIGGTFEYSTVVTTWGRCSSATAVAALSRVIHGSASAWLMSGLEQSRYARLWRSRSSGPDPRHGAEAHDRPIIVVPGTSGSFFDPPSVPDVMIPAP